MMGRVSNHTCQPAKPSSLRSKTCPSPCSSNLCTSSALPPGSARKSGRTCCQVAKWSRKCWKSLMRHESEAWRGVGGGHGHCGKGLARSCGAGSAGASGAHVHRAFAHYLTKSWDSTGGFSWASAVSQTRVSSECSRYWFAAKCEIRAKAGRFADRRSRAHSDRHASRLWTIALGAIGSLKGVCRWRKPNQRLLAMLQPRHHL